MLVEGIKFAYTTKSGRLTGINLVARSLNGETESHCLRTIATVEPFFRVETRSLGTIRRVPGVERLEFTATFTTHSGERLGLALDDRPVKPGGVVQPADLDLTLEPVEPDEFGYASTWIAHASVPADGPRGPHGITVRVTSNVTRPDAEAGETYDAQAFLPYRLTGPAALDATFASFGLMRPGATGNALVREVGLTRIDPALDLNDLRATFVPDEKNTAPWVEAATARLSPGEADDRFTLTIELPAIPQTADGAFRGRVRIDLDREGEPPLWVGFSGVVRKGKGR